MGVLVPAFAAIGSALGASAATATAVGVTATAATVGAAGVAYQAYASSQASKYQAQVAANNATIAKYNADQAIQEGDAAETQEKGLTSRRVGAAIAAQGANGIDTGYGSAVETQGGIKNAGDMDAATLRYNAAQKAVGYLNQGQGYMAQSSLDRSAATSAQISGVLGVGSSLIGGASSLTKTKLAYMQYTGGA